MGKTVEESLPRNLAEAARMPDAGPQVNRVQVLKFGTDPELDTRPKCTGPADDPWQQYGNQ